MAVKKDNHGIDKDLCRMITPEFRVSYPHVFKAQSVKPTDKPKFSITMLFPKTSDLKGSYIGGEPVSIKKVIQLAKTAAFGEKENWPEDLHSPVDDGDAPKNKDKPGYAGHWVIKASSNADSKPGVVDKDGTPITELSDFYPGCYARAYVYAYVWEYMGKQGVGFILDHVQKTKDGKAFGGKKPVEQVFTPINAGVDDEDDADNEVSF